jgi:hypothetical protein
MELKSMKRFQQFPDESAKVGQILFWLFPYEQNTFYRRRTRSNRVTRGAADVRVRQGERQINRDLALK